MSPADPGTGVAPDDSGPEVERIYQPKLDRVVLARLLGYARPYRGRIIVAILLLLLVAGLELVFPLLTRRGIDRYIQERDLHGLAVLSLAYLGLLIAVFAIRYLQLVLTQATGQRITTDLRDSLFAHVQSLDQAWFERNPVGRIMTRLTGDVEALNELFTSGLVSIFGDIVTLLGIAGLLVALNPRLAVLTLTVVPLLLVATMVFRVHVRAAYAVIRVRVAAINAYLQESIAGISLVALFHRERIHEERFARLNAAHREAFLKSVFYYSVYFPVVELLEALALALILWYGGIVSLRGALSLGSLVAFIQYSERFFRPIRDISERYNILQGAMASSERIFDLLDTKPRIALAPLGPSESRPPEARDDGSAAPGTPAVEFRDVRFSYLPGEEVLKGLSFAVKRGESVALVGPTGAGKTTVSTLLCRFRDVDAGAVLVDGRDVRRWDLRQLRRRVALVPQEAFLWTGDIRMNVALRAGRPLDRVEEAVRLTGLGSLVERFSVKPAAGLGDAGPADVTAPAGNGGAMPGDDTADGRGAQDGGHRPQGVGERGSQLSSGERQLVSIARALAADPPILVLDEATSNVDTETEQRIRAALRELLRGRTSLVIAHRLSTIRFVDRILVLHHGGLVEDGTHEELLRHDGVYARYYELEYRGQEAIS